MASIVWLASYPKSGNTWVRAFLHNLFRNATVAHDINRMDELTLGDTKPSAYTAVEPAFTTAWPMAETFALRARVHRAIAASRPDSVFVKTHTALVEAQGHPLVTMEVTSGAIYIVRNPLDVAVSFADHFGLSLDTTIAHMGQRGHVLPQNEINAYELVGSWSENVESWTQRPTLGLHVVRYEDLLDQPRKTFGSIASFLGVEPPRERLERAIKLSSFKVLKEQERRRGFRERAPHAQAFFRKGTRGQWRTELAAQQVARVVADHGKMMQRFGYLDAAGQPT
ncbi:MAG: sulfotransferase domain-containing protein [Alphaproteobacteria bacterium]|nr:sulfotransferase domain-containing protein [Alphaproteobacteria bacterium]